MAGEPSYFEIGAPDVEQARKFYGSCLAGRTKVRTTAPA